jgi:lipocalin
MLALALFACAVSGATAIKTVPVLDPLKYVGRWYQMFSDALSDTIESRYCVTADYGVFPNITVSVLNRDRAQSVSGPENQIAGWASIDPKAPGELTVHLGGVPVPAPYWVVDLGPVDPLTGLYTYAVVTDPFQASLFVLARNVTYFYSSGLNQSLYTTLINEGFDTIINKPVPTNQIGCTYWPS